MPTLDFLMEDKKPGEIRVRREAWPDYNKYFTPYFKNVCDGWVGQCDDGSTQSYGAQFYSDWHLYTEPKKKVKRWLWATKRAYWVMNQAYMTEDECKEEFIGMEIIKIPQSEMEFPE